jgi:hypothetical protein
MTFVGELKALDDLFEEEGGSSAAALLLAA